MSEIVLINISGHDRPGITHSLMAILAAYGVRILDIGQAMIHDNLALGILVKIPEEAHSAPVLKEVLYAAHQQGLWVRFAPVGEAEYERWAHGEQPARWVVTLLGRRITAEHIQRIARTITGHGLNIEDIVRLSGRSALHDEHSASRACLELTLSGRPRDTDAMTEEFLGIASELGVDISFQEDNVYRRNRRLVVFDMDSTLIQHEVIDELAKEAGTGEQVARVTAAAMRGELDFAASLRQRVATLQGLPETVLAQVAERLELTEGAERMLHALRAGGYRTAIISGGFGYFGRFLQRRLPLDYVHANELEIRNKHLTGGVVGGIVDGARKAELLRDIAAREGLALEQVAAVGDGANDLLMLRSAGLGIAFHAKPVVAQSASHAISTIGLDGVLYLLGEREPAP